VIFSYIPFTFPQTSKCFLSNGTKNMHILASGPELQVDKCLLHSVLMLVQSWFEPPTKWVSEKLLNLEQGVVVLISKMLNEGMLTTSYYEQGVAPFNLQPEVLESVLRDYTLLSCFKKDAHKMETFLKLLKCHQTEKYICFLY
uniref:Somatolactin alpha n=1 Tax=Hucho hucho TaxID=62062 RepID=A0A4W5LGJ4_9TELE